MEIVKGPALGCERRPSISEPEDLSSLIGSEAMGGERLNLIGVDYQTRTRFGPPGEGIVNNYLNGVEPLILAGHTHGGQVTLEFISPDLSPSRLITSYVRGWFQEGDAHLYVNRGIGTIFVPIRFESPPEITLFELQRG